MRNDDKQPLSGKQEISLAVIYVEYDSEQYGDSFPRLRKYLAAMKNCRITYMRVDNKHEDIKATSIEKDVYRVGGDNKYREFSGWQKGLETVGALNIPCDIILFVNSAFLKPGESFLKDYADIALLRRSLDNNAIIGRIDNSGKRLFLYGYDVSSWVCTNCFFAPKSVIEKLPDLVQIKDNIIDFIDDDYNTNHLLLDKEITSSDIKDGHFVLHADLDYDGLSDLRIVIDKSFQPKQLGLSDDDRELSIHLTELSISGQNIDQGGLIRGFYGYPKDRWIARNALITIPPDDTGRLVLKGYIPPDVLRKYYDGSLRITIFNDSLLFKKKAPMSRNYQQWIVEWLTEHWYSKIEINAKSWDTFKRKVVTILNEALLSAKFIELGYPIEPHGRKKYY